MPAYAVAHPREAAPVPEIAEYVERVTATFEPFGGRFPSTAEATREALPAG